MRANIVIKNQLLIVDSEELCNVPCFKEGLVKKLRSKMPPEEAIEGTRVLFGALADRARLKILYSLKYAGELCVCDVAHVLGSSVSTASHHLRKLRDLKLLKYRNDGKMSYYSLKDEFAVRLVTEALGKAER
jgi:DNA-binding transcriptional ArsR family regulator